MVTLHRANTNMVPVTKTRPPCRKAMKAMMNFKAAVEELAFIGTMRPETWPAIQESYKKAQLELEKYLVKDTPNDH
jgi:hypothetical protein